MPPVSLGVTDPCRRHLRGPQWRGRPSAVKLLPAFIPCPLPAYARVKRSPPAGCGHNGMANGVPLLPPPSSRGTFLAPPRAAALASLSRVGRSRAGQILGLRCKRHYQCRPRQLDGVGSSVSCPSAVLRAVGWLPGQVRLTPCCGHAAGLNFQRHLARAVPHAGCRAPGCKQRAALLAPLLLFVARRQRNREQPVLPAHAAGKNSQIQVYALQMMNLSAVLE